VIFVILSEAKNQLTKDPVLSLRFMPIEDRKAHELILRFAQRVSKKDQMGGNGNEVRGLVLAL